jgi:hypothetical protein
VKTIGTAFHRNEIKKQNGDNVSLVQPEAARNSSLPLPRGGKPQW